MPAKKVEQRVDDLEQIVGSIPDILNVRFDNARSERAQIRADVADVKASVTTLQADMRGLQGDMRSMQAELRAMPRIIVEVIREMDGKA